MSARGLVSIDVRVKLSIDVVAVVSMDVLEVFLINDARFSLRIERSKRDGSEKKSISSLLLLVLIGIYLKDKKFFYVSNYDSK